MNSKNLLAAAVLTACATFASANPNESSISVVAGNKAEVFKVVYKSSVANRVTISIFNSNKEEVFTETLTKMNDFIRPYNFSALPEGIYTIEVLDAQGRKVEKVNYQLGSVETLIRVTQLAEKSKFMLSVANQGSNEISVEIYNGNGALMHSESRAVSGDFAIVYNLLETGSYTFVVADKNGNTRTIQY